MELLQTFHFKNHCADIWHIKENINWYYKTKLNVKLQTTAKALILDTHVVAKVDIFKMHTTIHKYLVVIQSQN